MHEILESSRIDPATDCDALFDRLAAGMIEIKPGQRYMGPKLGVRRLDGEPLPADWREPRGFAEWFIHLRWWIVATIGVLTAGVLLAQQRGGTRGRPAPRANAR